MNMDKVNGADIDAINEWYEQLAKFFLKYKFTATQFGELLGEVTEGIVLDWTSGTPIETMIEDVLHAAATKMSNFTEDHWAVASFLRKHGNQPITIRLSKHDLSQCGPEFQTAVMNATLLPESTNLSLRLSSFPSDDPYLNIGNTLQFELRDINPTFAEWSILGRGMNYYMASTSRFNVDKWREHMDLILSTATVNLWVLEGGMSVMNRIGSNLFDSSAPLGLPRSAPLRLAGDDQSMGRDYDIRQSSRDLASPALPAERLIVPSYSKGISNDISMDNTVHLGVDVSRGPFSDIPPLQHTVSSSTNPNIPSTTGIDLLISACSTPLPLPSAKSTRESKDGEANSIAGMMRGQLEQYLISRHLPTSGTIQQLRERALLRLQEGTPEKMSAQPTDQSQARQGKKWWITRSGNYQSTLFIDLQQFIKSDGFNFLQQEGVIINNPNDWTDNELWETVWEYMIPHTGSDTGPNEDGRFLRTCYLSPRLAMMVPSSERNLELVPLNIIPNGQIIRIFCRSMDSLSLAMNNNNQPPIVSIRYRTANLYKGERMLHLLDQQYRTADTPDRGTCPNDIMVYHDQDNSSIINKNQSLVVIPNRGDQSGFTIDKKRRDVPVVSVRDVKPRKHMQVSDVYCHMRGLGILSLDAVTAGAMSLMEVTAQILVSLQIYAQVTMVEVSRLLEHGPQSLDFELWLPYDVMGETMDTRQRAEAHLNPQFGMLQQTVIRGKFQAHFRDVKSTLIHILSYYVNLLQLNPLITQALIKLVDRIYPILQQFRPSGATVANFMWVLRKVCLMIDRIFSKVQPSPQTMVVQSLCNRSEYLHEHHNETQGMDSVTSVVQALDRLPDFDSNLTLLDELRERQTGRITKGDGYMAPKTDSIPRVMEAIEVEKNVKAKSRRAPRSSKKKDDTVPSSQSEQNVVTSTKSKPEKPSSKSSTKKDTKQSRTVSILEQSKSEDTLDRPCAYYNSAGGCSSGTSCRYSHRLPTDTTEAKQVKYMMDRLRVNGSSDFVAAYPNLEASEVTANSGPANQAATSKPVGAKKTS